MRLFLPVFAFILAGCGVGLEIPEHDSRFDPVIEQFAKDMEFFGVDGDPFSVNVAFGETKYQPRFFGIKVPLYKEKDADGICVTIGKGMDAKLAPLAALATGKFYKKKFVLIDPRLAKASLSYLESVVYHELGHCVLGLGHDKDSSIMNPEGATEMLQFRYFSVGELMGHRLASPSALFEIEEVTDGLELVYKVDYQAFGKSVSHRLFFDHNSGKYVFIDNR